jgi:two-component system invasion response regulator UvrY
MEKQITVLIADDNTFMRESIKMLLADAGDMRLVAEAVNGEEAIRLARELLPDIILMDIDMKPVNGFEATRKILKENPRVKVIGLSMHVSASYGKNLLQLGAKGFISKSAAPSEILLAIREVVAGRFYTGRE